VVLVFFLPTLVAAPVEELLFRGLLMRWLRIWLIRRGVGRRAGDVRTNLPLHASVVVSALVFAAAHLYEVTGVPSLAALGVQTFALGVINGYLASRTGRLGAAVTAHGLLNLITAVTVLTR
jgi:membrane protease YdiL (CAAX protease family)